MDDKPPVQLASITDNSFRAQSAKTCVLGLALVSNALLSNIMRTMGRKVKEGSA